MKDKINPKTLSGFMELMPQDQILFEKIKKVIEEVYSSYGFYPLDTPVIEASEVLLAKAGGETEKQIYRFNKGDNDLSLRFDLTVPLAKYVASRYNDLIFPFKRYQIGKVYRGERAQKGRFREFYQCDIDVVGNESLSISYDAEIPSIIYDIFKRLDVGDFVIKINNRKILSGFFESLNLNTKIIEILRVIDKIEKIGLEKVKEELKDLKIEQPHIDKIIDFILIDGSVNEKIEQLKNLSINNIQYQEGINELEFVINTLEAMDIDCNNYEIDLTIARGLDYYTGTVYETFLDEYRFLGSVCSGGRYDNLAEYYTEKKLPGVGISIGLSRLFFQLTYNNIIKANKKSTAKILIISMLEDLSKPAEIATRLRNNGINTQIYVEKAKIKKQFKYANNLEIPYVIVLGEDEINNGTVSLKNMQTGEQTEMKIDELCENPSKYLID